MKKRTGMAILSACVLALCSMLPAGVSAGETEEALKEKATALLTAADAGADTQVICGAGNYLHRDWDDDREYSHYEDRDDDWDDDWDDWDDDWDDRERPHHDDWDDDDRWDNHGNRPHGENPTEPVDDDPYGDPDYDEDWNHPYIMEVPTEAPTDDDPYGDPDYDEDWDYPYIMEVPTEAPTDDDPYGDPDYDEDWNHPYIVEVPTEAPTDDPNKEEWNHHPYITDVPTETGSTAQPLSSSGGVSSPGAVHLTFSQKQITVSEAAGAEVSVYASVTAPALSGFADAMEWDERLTFVDASPVGRCSDYAQTATNGEKTAAAIAWANPSAVDIDGDFLRVDLKLPDDVHPGDVFRIGKYDTSYNEWRNFDIDYVAMDEVTWEDGYIEIVPDEGLPENLQTGDLNYDGERTLSDLVRMQKELLTGPFMSDLKLQASDVNGDGEVDVLDLVALKRKVTG